MLLSVEIFRTGRRLLSEKSDLLFTEYDLVVEDNN